MAAEKSPAFQFYPKDFLTDGHVLRMSMEARGVYITLLSLCWTETEIPTDPTTLAQMLGISKAQLTRVWPQLVPCFIDGSDGMVRHGRLDRERAKQAEYSDQQRARVERRWDKTRGRGNTVVLPDAVTVPPPGNTLHLQSSSASASAEEIQEASVSAKDLPIAQMTPPRRPLPVADVPSDEIGTRAAAFIDRYAALYPQYRHGARYMARPSLDYMKACDLCMTWPDDRLDKLAIIFLKCQEPFAAGGSRTIGQFAAMASWCDGRLAEVERGVAS